MIRSIEECLCFLMKLYDYKITTKFNCVSSVVFCGSEKLANLRINNSTHVVLIGTFVTRLRLNL